MDYLPLFIDVRERKILVVGGGEAATPQVRLLVRAKAAVLVIANDVGAEMAELASAGALRMDRRPFAADDVIGCTAVFGASGDAALDEAVSAAARAAGVPVNVVDRPELSSFIVPAIVDRGPLLIRIPPGTARPILTRRPPH